MIDSGITSDISKLTSDCLEGVLVEHWDHLKEETAYGAAESKVMRNLLSECASFQRIVWIFSLSVKESIEKGYSPERCAESLIMDAIRIGWRARQRMETNPQFFM